MKDLYRGTLLEGVVFGPRHDGELAEQVEEQSANTVRRATRSERHSRHCRLLT